MSETDPAELHAQAQLELQQVIDRVARDLIGAPMADIRVRLETELRAAGHWPQPEPWLRAVCLELADGRVYVVTKLAYRDPHGH